MNTRLAPSQEEAFHHAEYLRNTKLHGCMRKITIFLCNRRKIAMRWTKPKITEICIGLEINDYFPAEI